MSSTATPDVDTQDRNSSRRAQSSIGPCLELTMPPSSSGRDQDSPPRSDCAPPERDQSSPWKSTPDFRFKFLAAAAAEKDATYVRVTGRDDHVVASGPPGPVVKSLDMASKHEPMMQMFHEMTAGMNAQAAVLQRVDAELKGVKEDLAEQSSRAVRLEKELAVQSSELKEVKEDLAVQSSRGVRLAEELATDKKSNKTAIQKAATTFNDLTNNLARTDRELGLSMDKVKTLEKEFKTLSSRAARSDKVAHRALIDAFRLALFKAYSEYLKKLQEPVPQVLDKPTWRNVAGKITRDSKFMSGRKNLTPALVPMTHYGTGTLVEGLNDALHKVSREDMLDALQHPMAHFSSKKERERLFQMFYFVFPI